MAHTEKSNKGANKKKKSQEQIWKERLSSPNQEVVRETIKEIRDFGNIKILPFIIEKYASEKDELVKKELFKLLTDIKYSQAGEIIFSYIRDDNFKSIRKDLLSVLWQSAIDFAGYLPDLVDIFINEPFDIAFEAFTVIEYIDRPVDKAIASQNIDKLKEALPDMDEQKKFLSVDLVDVLKRWL